MSDDEFSLTITTTPNISFLFKDPELSKITGMRSFKRIKMVMFDNMDNIRYDKIDKDILEKCIYQAILQYVRSHIYVDDDNNLTVVFDAKTILEKSNWAAASLGDTEPCEQIIELTDRYLLSALGKNFVNYLS